MALRRSETDERLERLYACVTEAEGLFKQYVHEIANTDRECWRERVCSVTKDLHRINREITRLRR